ncbi:MAG: sirohydrochlorin cobaltochelatase [Desulfovibrio sp.]|nr:sirohydrochlorin cobaltochelatase [Desulfovibrio sp.]
MLRTLCLILLMLWTCPALAAQAETKEAILLVAFGTSVQKAQTSYANVEKQVRTAFPGKEIRWAWTANSLLNADPKSPRFSVQEALAKLATEGVRKVSILSLHVIPGSEYSNLARTARAFEGLPKGVEEIRLSQPLLYDTDSVSKVAQLLIQSAPKERKPDEALVFVGHGTHHTAGVYYPALQYYLHTRDKNVFVGTVEGSPDLEAVLKTLKANAIRKVWLAPLMTVAGDHAVNDLFGPEKDSWKQIFVANGMQVEIIGKGLGEYPILVEQWVQNLKSVVN